MTAEQILLILTIMAARVSSVLIACDSMIAWIAFYQSGSDTPPNIQKDQQHVESEKSE